MIEHLSMDQLLTLREPGSEPGTAAARAHVDACDVCRQELDRLHQRVARLKALPALRPNRDRWPTVRAQRAAERRERSVRWVGVVGFGLAASIALVLVSPGRGGKTVAVAQQLTAMQQKSAALEATLDDYQPEVRVVDGRTARVAADIEDRIAALDRELEMTELVEQEAVRQAQLLTLWRERVGLLDALVDVHVTRASNVGL